MPKTGFRRRMREIARRGPTLGVDLSCPDVGQEHDWQHTIDPRQLVCVRCAELRDRGVLVNGMQIGGPGADISDHRRKVQP